MSSPERGEGSSSEENDLEPYYRAARFSGEVPAGRAYFACQEVLFNRPNTELSVYRFLLTGDWHVAVLGDPPPKRLERTLRRILAAGEITPLPDDLVRRLMERRVEATKLGPWVERHHRSRHWP